MAWPSFSFTWVNPFLDIQDFVKVQSHFENYLPKKLYALSNTVSRIATLMKLFDKAKVQSRSAQKN